MNEDEATELVKEWNLDENKYDIDGIVEDLMDDWDPEQKGEILYRNEFAD